jgi:hypothetical protein
VVEWDWTSNFEAALAALDYADRRLVEKALAKFERAPHLPGLHLEKLRGQENAWSIRASLSLRCLMSKQAGVAGVLWLFEDVGPHDIYRQVRR